MLITNISMKGFKNHVEEVSFDLNEKTFITGPNGSGKTTIGEAIVWCLLGTDLVGNERATNRLLNSDSKNMEVEMDFIFQGENFNLLRSKKGTKNDIYLNGNIAKVQDLVQFYRDKDTFLSIFNPSYFPSLAPKDAKELLNNILKPIKNEDVFNQISEYERNLLIDNNFKNPNLFLENKREELKEIEKDIIFSEGFISAKNEEIEIPEEMNFDSTELNGLYETLKNINETITRLERVDKPALEPNSVERELSICRDEYKRLDYDLGSLNSVIECPKCKTAIDLDIKTKSNLVERMKSLAIEGKELAARSIESKKNNEQLLKEYSETLEKNKIEIEELKISCEPIQKQINELELKRIKVEANNSTRLSLLKLQEDNQAKIIKAKAEIEKGDSTKDNIKSQIDAAKSFNSTRLKMQSSNIDIYLKEVSIQFEKLTKDGEVKDDFKILYEGREFNSLSNSERIKAGLEIANLIINQIDMKIPIFIDNAESITEYMAPDTQVIDARVVAGQGLEVKAE